MFHAYTRQRHDPTSTLLAQLAIDRYSSALPQRPALSVQDQRVHWRLKDFDT